MEGWLDPGGGNGSEDESWHGVSTYLAWGQDFIHSAVCNEGKQERKLQPGKSHQDGGDGIYIFIRWSLLIRKPPPNVLNISSVRHDLRITQI